MESATGSDSPKTAPFVIRLVEGDITRVQSSMIVVNHFNGVAPAGAEAAIDKAMDGALSRRAAGGALLGRFGSTYVLPAQAFPLASPVVLVIGLGEPEAFSIERLPEIGTAIVEAAAIFQMRDAATILHMAGSSGVDPEQAARLLTTGILSGLSTVTGAGCLRAVSIVERETKNLPAIEKGVMAAAASPAVHVYLEKAKIPGEAPTDAVQAEVKGVSDHLRVGITRSGAELKVTAIGHDAFDRAVSVEFPAAEAQMIGKNLANEVLNEADPARRLAALKSIGAQLYANFFDRTGFNLDEFMKKPSGSQVIFRLDDATVDLPWEILCVNDEFLVRRWPVARQLEISVLGRQSAMVDRHEKLRVLVIGDPTGDLPGARHEAEVVRQMLTADPMAEVKALIGEVTYDDVSREIDTVSYDLMHYAGHAKFDELRENSSGLILKGHTLTAQDLSTRRFLPRFVFANACNSAQSGGTLPDPYAGRQATINMVSGLLAGGVRAFVGSMWRVDDQAACTFAETFYQALLGGGQQGEPAPIGEAVKRSREAVIKVHGEHEPAWAGYALYGSPWQNPLKSVGG